MQVKYKIDGKLFCRSGCKLPLMMTITELRLCHKLNDLKDLTRQQPILNKSIYYNHLDVIDHDRCEHRATHRGDGSIQAG